MKLTKRTWWLALALFTFAIVGSEAQTHAAARAQTRDASDPIASIQTVLAIGALDGWLLARVNGQNEVAQQLVSPSGKTNRDWFYFIPAKGTPALLCFKDDAPLFAHLGVKTLVYEGRLSMEKLLASMLESTTSLAMEYAPRSGIPSLTQVSEDTVRLVRSLKKIIHSSAMLVQHAQSTWKTNGRIAHAIAAHHLSKTREDTLAYIEQSFKTNVPVSAVSIQSFIVEQFQARDLVGERPVVLIGSRTSIADAGANTSSASPIGSGDLILLDLSAVHKGSARPIVAELSWVAYVGDVVPPKYERAFKAVALARDSSIKMIRDRLKGRRPIRGYEVDKHVRSVFRSMGFADRFPHPTGHSLDTSKFGSGANLDDFQSHDTRTLVADTGFTIGPGLYWTGEYGMRSVVSAYLGKRTLKITTTLQKEISIISAR